MKKIVPLKRSQKIRIFTIRISPGGSGAGGVLALTWNFGKLTENVSKKKGVNNDDILTRPAAPAGN